MPTAANHVFRNSYSKVRIPCELRRCTTADDVMCQIFQMHPCDVTFDDLPDSWLVNKQEFNTIVLPCKHTFHVSALALHFVLTDMRCPVCRCGHQYRADINSLPKCYQEAFDKRKKEIKDTLVFAYFFGAPLFLLLRPHSQTIEGIETRCVSITF